MDNNSVYESSLLADFEKINDTVDMDTKGEDNFIISEMVWLIFDGIIGTLGILGNGLVIYVFLRMISLQNLVNCFIINQSLIDFTTSIVFMLLHLGPQISLKPGNRLHLFLCRFWVSQYVMWSLIISSSCNLMNITLERFVAIMMPRKYKQIVGTVRSRIMIVSMLTWLLGFIFDSAWGIVHEIIPPRYCYPVWRTPIIQGCVGVMTFLITYLIPLSLMMFTYFQIIRQLRHRVKPVEPNQEINTISAENQRSQPNRDNKPSARSTANKNIVKTMLSVSTVYTICWGPAAFNYLVYNLGVQVDFTSTWFHITKVFVNANMCANPFVYAMQYRKFQDGLKRAFGVKSAVGTPQGSRDTGTSRMTSRAAVTNENLHA